MSKAGKDKVTEDHLEDEKVTVDIQSDAENLSDTETSESVSTAKSAESVESNESKDEKDEVEELKKQIKTLDEEVSSLKDQYLRKQADFENFRKRLLRDKEDSIRYANSSLLNDTLTIIDDFERAIKSSEESEDFQSFHSGIELIEKQFVGMLERKYGVKRMESLGLEFDPEKHEAVGMEPSDEYDTQVVLEDYQKGYMLNDRVLRHAKVKVSMPSATTNENNETENEENK